MGKVCCTHHLGALDDLPAVLHVEPEVLLWVLVTADELGVGVCGVFVEGGFGGGFGSLTLLALGA